ncbi:hypothetical protein Theos_1103 [Thermus oshimai JL-2]|uniref:Uncharacterized protein n=1 Tax=Thermus oshimai JL-2 TaxID=751945 RepID=K7RIC6_THEOS|nr:hypothetical protein [Thermus oshimai]AFV76152.1 hypothetical protein Theos_1103 [Thermus oshimai JL-2]
MWKVLFLLLPRLLPRPRPLKPPPAWVREAPFLHTPLCLDLPYYPARGEGGVVLIPWDRYAEEAEELLEGL